MLRFKFQWLAGFSIFFIFPAPFVFSMATDSFLNVTSPTSFFEISPPSIQSDFFKDDPLAYKIVAEGIPVDLASLNLLKDGSPNGVLVIDRSSFAYKLFSAFHMLGYSSSPKSLSEVPYYHLTLLNQFQEKYGFPISPILTVEVFVKLDELLTIREKMHQFYAEKFPLLDHIPSLYVNDVAVEYIAMLYTLPIHILPQHLQIESQNDYYDCIAGQCQGAIVPDPENSQNYFFDNLYFTNQSTSALPPSATHILTIILHEYAHYLDGMVSNVGQIDTLDFYKISWKMPSPNHCTYRKSEDPADFVTQYAFRGYSASNPCPIAEQYKFTEDFADSFAAYVVNGKGFRAATLKNSVLAQKYTWLKENVFYGKEYDTDLPSIDYLGCFYGNNLYFDCDDRYVWDGGLREVYRPELEIQRDYSLERPFEKLFYGFR